MSKLYTLLAQLNATELNIPTNRADSGAFDNALDIVYFAAGVVAVISLIIGGYYYVLSNGDSGRITKAKNIILYSVIGLVIVALAFTITQFIIGRAQG